MRRTIFKAEDFIRLSNGTMLEVVYADEIKAVCLKLFTDGGDWFYEGGSAVISNRAVDYGNQKSEWEKVSKVNVMGKSHWKPLVANYVYPML